MDIRRMQTCEKCRTSVPLEKIRLFPGANNKTMAVCVSCSTKIQKPPEKTKSAPTLPAPEFVTLVCKRCNYAFRADQSKAGVTHRLHCPYCGKQDQLKRQ